MQMNIFAVLSRRDLSRFSFLCLPSQSIVLLGQKSKYLLEELPITCRHLLKLLIFSIKLAASLSARYRPVTLIFELSTMSNCNADRSSFTLFTGNVAFQLSVILLTTFDIPTSN